MIRPFYFQYDRQDVELLVTFLNTVKTSGARRKRNHYKRLAQLVNEFKDISEARPIPYNVFSNEKERELFENSKAPRAWLINGERIITSDPKHVRGLAVLRLNSRLEKHLFHATVEIPEKGKTIVRWEGRSTIGTFVHLVLRLIEADLLKRICQCEQCRKWLYAERSTRRFCSVACSKLNWQTSETGKARRRAYMRKYMQKYRRESI